MKNLLLIFSILILSSCSKNLWNVYRPAQSNIVGKKIKSYDKRTNKISLGEVNADGKLEFVDEPSTATESELIDKKLKLDIQGFLKEKAKVVDVKTTNSTVTHISGKSIKYLRPGRFVFSAIKAENAVIELKKDTETTITPKDLEDYLKTINPTISEVAGLVKEIKSTNNTTIKYEITNPEVYVLFQQAELNEVTQPDKWFKNFNTYEGEKFILSPQKRVTETVIKPVISKTFRKKVASIGVQLLYEKKEKLKRPQLYARYTTSSGSKTKLIPELSGGGAWNTLKLVLDEYDLSETHYKVVYLEIDAVQVGDNIQVNKAKVYYPEKSIKVIKN